MDHYTVLLFGAAHPKKLDLLLEIRQSHLCKKELDSQKFSKIDKN
jgi:hypothetical protein